MRTMFILAALITAFLPFATDHHDPDFQSLYAGHQWFKLRDAVEQTKAPLFYRGAVAAAFNQPEAGQAALSAVIRSGRDSQRVYDAREMLTSIYFRAGQYREALMQTDAMLEEKPTAKDVLNMQPLFRTLSKFPDQTVVGRKPSTIQMILDDGNLFLPVTIDGTSANYVFDDGFSTSGLSESEAKRLGLSVHEVGTKIDSMSGTHVEIRVAVANELVVGDVHLAHVAFYVLPDKQPPFDQLPPGKRGILGLPVLLALRTLRWSPLDGTFTCGFPSESAVGIRQPNLAFEGGSIFLQVSFQKKLLNFSLDTGAQHTDLYPPFAKEFPDLIAAGKRESHKLTGVGGSRYFDSVTLSSLTFQIGGGEVVLKPAHVLLKQNNDTSDWFIGNLGMDLLNQAHSVRLDFQAMRLTLD